MSADTTPIAPARFAAALKDLSIGMLHLKVLEIRNSIAHLQYSNDQLRPFAEGTEVASDSTAPAGAQADAAEPDQDCVDAIRENEQVIDRMMERVALIRVEVEERGVSWTEFQSKEEVEAKQDETADDGTTTTAVNGTGERNGTTPHSAWTDGTFQTGTISNGQVRIDSQPGQTAQGGSMTDEELSRALQERMRNLEDDDEEDGVHL